MTETELRKNVINTIAGWLGARKGSTTHKKILDIYNGHQPLARNYKMGLNDPWCAATVSAVWIECGIAEYTGTECSCGRFIEVAKEKGIWTERDGYMPKIGDAILYDWEDNGKGENQGAPNHIGIVTRVAGTSFTVTEGNKSSKVGNRTMKKDGRYIRGFITPDYAAIAKKLTGGPSNGPADGASDKPAFQPAQKRNSAYSRTWTVNSKSGLNMRWGAGTDQGILTTLKNGSSVKCYGYYNLSSNGRVWLCVVAGDLTGYVDKAYLK